MGRGGAGLSRVRVHGRRREHLLQRVVRARWEDEGLQVVQGQGGLVVSVVLRVQGEPRAERCDVGAPWFWLFQQQLGCRQLQFQRDGLRHVGRRADQGWS